MHSVEHFIHGSKSIISYCRCLENNLTITIDSYPYSSRVEYAAQNTKARSPCGSYHRSLYSVFVNFTYVQIFQIIIVRSRFTV